MHETETYICSKCGKSGVKLWRPSHYYFEPIFLLCAKCCCEETGVNYFDIDDKGLRLLPCNIISDQIGRYIPAVPCGDSYYGYTCSPQEDVKWWSELPNE